MNTLSFFVEGEPRAKQSFRSLGRRGGYTPKHIKAWQRQVAFYGLMAMNHLQKFEAMKESLTVELVFFLGNHRRVDLDNLSKAVLDGLNNVVWVDDRQIASLTINKYICRGNPGVLVKVQMEDRPADVTPGQQQFMITSSELGVGTRYTFTTLDGGKVERASVPA